MEACPHVLDGLSGKGADSEDVTRHQSVALAGTFHVGHSKLISSLPCCFQLRHKTTKQLGCIQREHLSKNAKGANSSYKTAIPEFCDSLSSTLVSSSCGAIVSLSLYCSRHFELSQLYY